MSTQEQNKTSHNPVSGSEIFKDADLIFVSDVHMEGEYDQKAAQLMAVIKNCHSAGVKNFVLGGDICEFFWARSKYFMNKFSFLFKELEKLSNSPTDVYFIQGNHEYCMEEISLPGVRILEADGASLKIKSGEKTLKVGISHGDLLNAPASYLKFKKLVNSSFFKFFFSMIPSKISDNFALNVAHQSRKKDKYRKLYHDAILGSAKERAEREDEHAHIFGHFHYPYQAECENGKKLLCVPSWDIPNALVLKSGHFFRVNLKKESTSVKKVEFKSISEYQ